MARGKYEDWLTEDGLLTIEGFARQGLIDKQIAANIGIAEATFTRWKKNYPSIMSALKKGKAPIDIQVENALLKRALGYSDKDITKTIEGIQDSTGHFVGKKKIKIVETTKNIGPDVSAAIFWLKNRRPDLYRRMSPEFQTKIEMETKKMEAEIKNLEAMNEKLNGDGRIFIIDNFNDKLAREAEKVLREEYGADGTEDAEH